MPPYNVVNSDVRRKVCNEVRCREALTNSASRQRKNDITLLPLYNGIASPQRNIPLLLHYVESVLSECPLDNGIVR